MTVLDTLITDRTQADVDRARALNEKGWGGMTQAERDEYAKGLRGAYGSADMNRVAGAMEYIDRLMRAAKRPGVYVPTAISHRVPETFDASGAVTRWRQWSDTEWIDCDYLTLELWTAHLANLDRLWAAARRFEAVVPARYDPDGTGYILPGAALDGGKLARVADSVGLLELRVVYSGPPGVAAQGTAWAVEQTDTGWTARMDYTDCPWPDLDEALAALGIRCTADQVTDGTFTLEATLRYDFDVTAGTCAVRWSPFMLWREAREEYASWGGAKPLTWGGAARRETV